MISLEDPVAAAEALAALSAEVDGHWHHDGGKLARRLGALPEPRKLALIRAVLARDEEGSLVRLVVELTTDLSPDLPEDLAVDLVAYASRFWQFDNSGALIVLVGRLRAAGRPVPPEFVGLVRRTAHVPFWGGRDLVALAATLPEPRLSPGEPWADLVLADLADLAPGWTALLDHAATATTARASAKWETRGRALLAAVGAADAHDRLLTWLAPVGRSRSGRLLRRLYDQPVNDLYDPANATALRGLIWLAALGAPTPATARTLGALVETSLRKVPGLGPRNPKIANAAVHALSQLDDEAALAQLARLATRVTFKGVLKPLHAALDTRAAALGLTRDEVEELAVPGYGLTEVGRRVVPLGEATAELTVVRGSAGLTWRTAAGKVVKSPPAAVRRDHPEELAELKAAVKDVDQMLSAQSERLDRQFLARRVWRLKPWRERYLDHPLVGVLARRLLWLVDGEACGYADGVLRRLDGSPVEAAGPEAEVRLWHPIDRDVAETLAWREWLERHQITQPFKQAHREVYPLTEAERRTRVYSNRFAAHVLRQHQFNALALARGWRNRLRLMVDDSYPPAVRLLPEWGLRAEFWIEGIGEEYGTDTTDSGSYLRLTTDQVRFYPIDAPEHSAHAGGGGYEQRLSGGAAPVQPLPLEQIPALVLSEVLRDVDLFVGVASVGNDPTWQDGGPGGRFRAYWESYSFGELTATAQTRKDLLARLLPRLAVGARSTLDGRFLRVRGDLRTYKIHLGSGNILMEPDDRYLCIVPGRSRADAEVGFLPFEGDRVLALILSKALLLADDTAITDPTITRQLRTR